MALSYEELKREIQEAPETWIPALLLEVAAAGYLKGVFAPQGASRLLAYREVTMIGAAGGHRVEERGEQDAG